jgi:hypothetical protein
MDDDDVVSWREIGVRNWARDCGFVMTQQDGSTNCGCRVRAHEFSARPN